MRPQRPRGSGHDRTHVRHHVHADFASQKLQALFHLWDLYCELRAQFGILGFPYQVLLHRQLRPEKQYVRDLLAPDFPKTLLERCK